ncbi:MAG: hypothetical protein ACRDZ4_10865 [Egibacteraceae bacterium]
MATRQHTTENLVGATIRVTWTGLLNGDDGSPVEAPDHTFKEVQVFGTFGAGGNLRVQGSLDGGTTFAALNDPQGNALNVGAAAIERVQESTARVRPLVTAGDGTTSLTVVMVLKLDGQVSS